MESGNGRLVVSGFGSRRMRLAILADIHGNLHALEAVLADIERQSVDLIVVNGDLVNRGPANVAVLDRVRSLDAVVTLGNHDDLVRKWIDRDADIPADWYEDPFWLSTAWCARQVVAADRLDDLRALPMTHRIEVPGAPSVLVAHGSPRHYREGYGRRLTDERIAEIVAEHPADVLVGSHTHRPLERRWNGHLVLNTGAVGAPQNEDSRAQYLLLTLRDGQWQHEFRPVPYDHDAAVAAFEATGFLAEGGLSALLFREDLRLAKDVYGAFTRWCEAAGRPPTWDAWRAFGELPGSP